MGRFLLAKAVIDGTDRVSVVAESALPHLPQWTAIDPTDVRDNPWDFEEPETTATPDVGDGPAEPATSEPADGQSSADTAATSEGDQQPDRTSTRRKPSGDKPAAESPKE